MLKALVRLGNNTLIRSLLLTLALSAAVAGASAQTAPAGWQVKVTQQSWVATSPALGNGDRVRLVFYPVGEACGELDAWFNGQIAERIQGTGIIMFQEPAISRQEAPPLSPLLRRAATLSRFGQFRSTIAMNFGYETVEGRQFVQIIMPARPGKPSGAYVAAVEQVAAAWGAGVVYRQSPASGRDADGGNRVRQLRKDP